MMTNIITAPSQRVDTINFILRGQPQHIAHEKTFHEAAKQCGTLNLIYGCANQPRDDADPFYQEERIEVGKRITANFKQKYGCDVNFLSVENSLYNNAQWGSWVAEAVEPFAHGNVKLIGHNKDESSFYLNMFPQWGEPILLPQFDVLDATTIRNLYFSKKNNLDFFRHVVPEATLSFMEEFMQTEAYEYIVSYADYIKNYRAQFANYAYPPVFQTGDAIVIKSGHVLMIERRSQPGKGLLAFPGGFLNAEDKKDADGNVVQKADVTLIDCAIRELYEETKIKIPKAVARGSIVAEKRFDHPKRSRRGRVITTAQLIVLDDMEHPGLPKVKGSDDAVGAKWYPLHQIKRRDCFEDHYDMKLWAQAMLASLKNNVA
jgi:bifunctional NMN adenylyltransferase/nudix hydrolase